MAFLMSVMRRILFVPCAGSAGDGQVLLEMECAEGTRAPGTRTQQRERERERVGWGWGEEPECSGIHRIRYPPHNMPCDSSLRFALRSYVARGIAVNVLTSD